jgi:hypothetical protein
MASVVTDAEADGVEAWKVIRTTIRDARRDKQGAVLLGAQDWSHDVGRTGRARDELGAHVRSGLRRLEIDEGAVADARQQFRAVCRCRRLESHGEVAGEDAGGDFHRRDLSEAVTGGGVHDALCD